MADIFEAADAYLQQELASPLQTEKRANLLPWAIGGAAGGAVLSALLSVLTRGSRPVEIVLSEYDPQPISMPVVPNRAMVRREVLEDEADRKREEEKRRRREERRRQRESQSSEKNAELTWGDVAAGAPLMAVSGLSTFALVKMIADKLRKARERRLLREEQQKLQRTLNEKEILLAELRRRLGGEKMASAVIEQYLRFEDLDKEKQAGFLSDLSGAISTTGKVIAGTSAAAFTLALLIRAINAYRERQRRKLQQLRAFDRNPGIQLITPEEQNFADVIREIETVND